MSTEPRTAQQINSSQVGSVEDSMNTELELEAEVVVLKSQLAEEKKIVDRVWKALGISTYDQAKPLSIDEHVTKLRAQLTGLTTCLEWADKNVVPFRGVSRFGWLAWVKDTGYHGPTLLQALTTAYENRDKTI